MKRRILVVDGASDSIKDTPDLLENVVNEIYPYYLPLEINKSMRGRKTAAALRLFFETYGRTTIICKSEGAYRVLQWLADNYDWNASRDIRVVSIDPHHWLAPFERKLKAVFATTNIYQENKWPKGKPVDGANNIKMPPGWGHTNIVHCEAVKIAIKEACE